MSREQVIDATRQAMADMVLEISWAMIVGSLILIAILVFMAAIVWFAMNFDFTAFSLSNEKPWLENDND